LSDASSRQLVDTPAEASMDQDSPFRRQFVAGSSWAPWLASGKFPTDTPIPSRGGVALPKVKPPEPPAPDASDEAYRQYRGAYEQSLDEAYADWKRSVFLTLFEPWVVDRRAAEAAKRLKSPPAGG
jgi:hypothetical protein